MRCALLVVASFGLRAEGAGLHAQQDSLSANSSAEVQLREKDTTTDFALVYSSYLCTVPHRNQRGFCAKTQGVNEDSWKLKEQIDHLPNDFHILVYGMSYIREISDNIVRHAFREATGPASVKLVVHGENKYPWKKPCFCGLEAKPCPCADFATYHIKRPRAAGGVNGRVTAVVNYEHLQTEANLHHLRALLYNSSYGFTHAIVMEPHPPCFFDEEVHDTPSCTGMKYGCGWGDALWKLFRKRFGASTEHGTRTLLHVAPWEVDGDAPLKAEKVALRTKPIAETHKCEARIDPDHPIDQPATGSPSVSEAHQCFAMCSPDHSSCHLGSPTTMAYEALKMLSKKHEE